MQPNEHCPLIVERMQFSLYVLMLVSCINWSSELMQINISILLRSCCFSKWKCFLSSFLSQSFLNIIDFWHFKLQCQQTLTTPQKILFCLLFEVLVFSTVHCSETCSWYQFHYGHFCHSESKLLGKIKYWIGWSFELMQFIYYWPSLKGGGNWSEKIEFPSCQVAKVIIQLDHFWPTVMCQHKWASSTMHIRVDLLKLWSQEWVKKREAEREKKR